MSNQLDLFGGVAAPVQGIAGAPARVERATIVAGNPGEHAISAMRAPTPAWARLLAEAPYTLEIFVSWHCTGVVVESLDDPPRGRAVLFSDGEIGRFVNHPAERRVRTLYLLPEAADALHASHPLVRIGPHGSQRHRFAGNGECVPATLDLPKRLPEDA